MERVRALTAADLDVERVGAGPPVVLVHGSIVDARRTWRRQLELADEWALCMPNRPGFAGSPPLPRGDFELEAPLIPSAGAPYNERLRAFLTECEERRSP